MIFSRGANLKATTLKSKTAAIGIKGITGAKGAAAELKPLKANSGDGFCTAILTSKFFNAATLSSLWAKILPGAREKQSAGWFKFISAVSWIKFILSGPGLLQAVVGAADESATTSGLSTLSMTVTGVKLGLYDWPAVSFEPAEAVGTKNKFKTGLQNSPAMTKKQNDFFRILFKGLFVYQADKPACRQTGRLTTFNQLISL